jgi:hypothetical protein
VKKLLQPNQLISLMNASRNQLPPDRPEMKALRAISDGFLTALELWPGMKAIGLFWESPETSEILDLHHARTAAERSAVLSVLDRVLLARDPIMYTVSKSHPYYPGAPNSIAIAPIVLQVVESFHGPRRKEE